MKWLYLFSLLTLMHMSVFGQTPEKMSYQAVIRDNSDVLLKNSNVNLKIIVRQGSSNGSSVYEETHYTKTNKNGLLSLEIGSGMVEKGSFKDIIWAEGPFFIETLVDIKGNSSYKINGVSEMLSVPYSLHAKSADSFTGTISPSQMPDFYTADEIDNILLDINTGEGVSQSLNLDQTELKITGGNKVSFENWDTNVSDDFSGIYDDLQNLPDLYNKTEIDNIIGGIETTGGISQNLNLDQNTLSISGGNSISFDNWDTNEADDFSGVYSDLQNIPDLYNKTEIDNIIGGIQTTGGISQNLNLDQNTLSISGGNSISFDNWDTNAADDFSGAYADLQNIPDLYNKTEIDNLIGGIETTGGISQNLNLDQNTLSISGGNSISFDNWDTNVADDFSGAYADLQNKPVLFSGVYTDLQNIPDLYNKSEIDNLITGIETTGSTPQNLNLDQNTLSISGGNSISFDNWDTNAADDFSGAYADLQNKPALFSGVYADLQNIPDLYNKTEIDNLITGIETTGGISQNLNLDQNTLSISGGNSVSFDNWDTNAADDFSGAYADLQNKPALFSGVYADLQNIPDLYNKTEIDNIITGIETTGGISQNLNLDQNTLSISGGNSISFDNWDTNAADDFDGAYSSLTGAPKVYTQDEVNAIKAEILNTVSTSYMKKPSVNNISSSRSMSQSDVNNTIACTSSATLTINSGFSAMQIGDISNIEVHGTTLTIQGSGVIINGVNSGKATIGNSKDYTGGILRKTGTNTYIVL